MTELIRLSKSCIGPAEKAAVLGVLDREHLGMGAEVKAFEQALSGFIGRPAVCVATGTAAIQLALQACNIGVGDEVLVPSLTYVATFQAISAVGATPVACDIDAETVSLDCRDAERRLTPRTTAIVPVHYSGGVGDLDAVYAFAHAHRIRVIEDAAHAFGTTYRGRRVGGFGDVACFSFDGIKNITSGEGGCIVSDVEPELEKMKDARLLGVQGDTAKRYEAKRSWEFDVTAQGWRYHMSNIMAAIGLVQLSRFAEFADTRRTNARLYDQLLRGHERIRPVKRDYDTVVPHIYVVRIDALQDRESLRKKLLEQGIQTGIHYQPNHWLSRYRDETARALPETDRFFAEALTLPMHCDLSESDIGRVCETLGHALAVA